MRGSVTIESMLTESESRGNLAAYEAKVRKFRSESVLVIQILLRTILQRDKVVPLLLPQIYGFLWKNSFEIRRCFFN